MLRKNKIESFDLYTIHFIYKSNVLVQYADFLKNQSLFF